MSKYIKEFKINAVNEYNTTKDIDYILNKYKISRSTLYDWINRYRKLTDKTKYTITDYLNLKNLYDKKVRELEIMERTHCFKDSPRKQKLEAVENLFGEYPVKEICRVIDLPTGTFYNHHFRRVKETQNAKRDKILKEHIKRVFEESEGRFSGNKICSKLKSEGIKISETKVYELMKQLGLKSKHSRKRIFVQKQAKYPYLKNKLNRQFYPSEPNIAWVSDTTKVWAGNTLFSLCVILDLFSRKVIAYRLSSQENYNLIMNTFKDAYESRHPNAGLIFHSDRGIIYTSKEFRDFIHSLKIEQSFSKKANPYDNAVIESFFGTMKLEELNSHNFEYYDELKECVDKYIEFYNDYRPHSTLKNKTPNQVEKEFFCAQSE